MQKKFAKLNLWTNLLENLLRKIMNAECDGFEYNLKITNDLSNEENLKTFISDGVEIEYFCYTRPF